MKTIEVELWAFGGEGRIRPVEIPESTEEAPSIGIVLEAVFHFGQNDFQPKPFRSVSVGDVVRLGERRYTVAPCGFTDETGKEVA